MGVIDTVRKDVSEFFGFLVEKGLAKDTYNNGRIEVTSTRWILTNIAEILSTEDVVCNLEDVRDDEGKVLESKLCVTAE